MKRGGFWLLCALALVLTGCAGQPTSSNSTNSGGTSPTPPPPPSAPNELPVTVGLGPVPGEVVNRPYVSVTVCVPGTSNCQTINDVLLDSGSTGLRIFSSVLTIPLVQQTGAQGPEYECAMFEGSFLWGTVVTADMRLSGEVALNVPIQVAGDTSLAPGSCSNGQTGKSSPQQTDYNGILGVTGNLDCGACTITPLSGFYYACASPGNCQPAAFSQVVQNPVSAFTVDNNGVVFDLPGIPAGGGQNVQGSLFFGIGTQSNNQLGSAAIFKYLPNGMTATYLGQQYFAGIDSGTSYVGLVNDAVIGLPLCGPYYCPQSPTTFPVNIQGTNGTSEVIDIVAADPTQAFNQGMTADYTLVGPSFGGNSVILGLPFFFNRKVFFVYGNTPSQPGPYYAW